MGLGRLRGTDVIVSHPGAQCRGRGAARRGIGAAPRAVVRGRAAATRRGARPPTEEPGGARPRVAGGGRRATGAGGRSAPGRPAPPGSRQPHRIERHSGNDLRAPGASLAPVANLRFRFWAVPALIPPRDSTARCRRPGAATGKITGPGSSNRPIGGWLGRGTRIQVTTVAPPAGRASPRACGGPRRVATGARARSGARRAREPATAGPTTAWPPP